MFTGHFTLPELMSVCAVVHSLDAIVTGHFTPTELMSVCAVVLSLDAIVTGHLTQGYSWCFVLDV